LSTCVAEAARQPNDAFARLGLAKRRVAARQYNEPRPIEIEHGRLLGIEDSVLLHARHVPVTPGVQRVLCAGQRHRAPKLVADFYQKAMLSGDAPAALGDVQRDFLVRLRKERGFDEAIRLAGAFVITSTTARKP
jgi:hypothetical protein